MRRTSLVRPLGKILAALRAKSRMPALTFLRPERFGIAPGISELISSDMLAKAVLMSPLTNAFHVLVTSSLFCSTLMIGTSVKPAATPGRFGFDWMVTNAAVLSTLPQAARRYPHG